jgi:hypothetical protein
MSDNTANARTKLAGHRATVRAHSQKWHDYREQYEKDFAWKTIQNAQNMISRLKTDHPSLRESSREDNWRPGDSRL